MLEKVLGSGNEFCGVHMWRAGAFFKQTLELWFQRQIFMIFIVIPYFRRDFQKMKNFKFVDNPFNCKVVLFFLPLIKKKDKKREEMGHGHY